MVRKKLKKFSNPQKHQKIFKKNYDIKKNAGTRPAFEDVSDSWDRDQEPKIAPMCSQQPYLSFT